MKTPETIQPGEERWDVTAEQGEDISVTSAQRIELDRCLAEYAADPHEGISLREVESRLHALSPRRDPAAVRSRLEDEGT